MIMTFSVGFSVAKPVFITVNSFILLASQTSFLGPRLTGLPAYDSEYVEYLLPVEHYETEAYVCMRITRIAPRN